MQKCSVCGADTVLSVSGVPLCLACDEDQSTTQAQPQTEPTKIEPRKKTVDGHVKRASG